MVIGVMADLIISGCPEYDRREEQAESRRSTRSMIEVRSSKHGFVVPIGRPK